MSETNPFEGINDALPSLGGNYIKIGEHVFRVIALKVIKSQNDGKMKFVAELKAERSTVHRVGEVVSWVTDLSLKVGLSNTKHFVAALIGCDFSDVDDDVCAGVVIEDQPEAGNLIGCQATNIKTKAGNDFTKCLWSEATDDAPTPPIQDDDIPF